ncbi:MAG TPA: hypothetical protein VLG50_03455 [Candidatus Saccharimonadales bacterium]|nr:hypothetical protein [Candidatus Saccharimonadales bacterium]
MKKLYFKIFLIALSWTVNYYASQLTPEELEAIQRADQAIICGNRKPFLERISLLYNAMQARSKTLKRNPILEQGVVRARYYYSNECTELKPNPVAEVLYGQAIIAFLCGKATLGESYILRANSIKSIEAARIKKSLKKRK